jgi:MFS family permease
MKLKPNPRGVLLDATIFVLVSVEFLQAGMTAFAAGPIMGELGLSPEEFSLIAAVYASVAIVAISLQRQLVEALGGRPYVQLSAALTTAGALLCASSHNFTSFLTGRMVMAAGGGALFTSARMVIQHLMAGPRFFRGVGFLATALSLGMAVAPWAASMAVSHDTWSAIYVLVAVLSLLAFALAGVALPATTPRPSHRSAGVPWSPLLLVLGSFGVLYALQRLVYDFHGDVALAAVVLAGAVSGLALYALRQWRAAQPLLRIRELLGLRYVAGVALFCVAYLVQGANNVVVPQLLQRTLGLAWETVGHLQALGLAAAVLTWQVMARLLPRSPAPRKYLAAGFASLALFGVLLARITPTANPWSDLLPALACNGVFLMTVMPVTAMQTFRGLESDEALFANAQQLKNMLGQACIALGITLGTLGQQWRAAEHYATLGARVNPANPAFAATLQRLQEALTPSMGPAQAARIATAQLAQMLSQQSALLANIDHFLAIAALALLGVLVTLVQRVLR